MAKSGTGFPDCFHLNALMGDDIGRSLLAATYKGFLAVREDSVPLEIWLL